MYIDISFFDELSFQFNIRTIYFQGMSLFQDRKSALCLCIGGVVSLTLLLSDYTTFQIDNKNTPSFTSGIIPQIKTFRREIGKLSPFTSSRNVEVEKNSSASIHTETNNVTSEIWKKLRKPQKRRTTRDSVDTHYSQAFQDQTVYNMFPRQQGFFIEMGAFDGKVHSNTLWLERKHNWTGLLIEGNPRSCAKIDQLQRQAWRLCACVSHEKSVSFILGQEVGGVEKNMAKSHVIHLKGNQRVKVPCFRLYSVLQIVGVLHVNYFSLDVEGGEISVLSSMKENLISRRIIVDVWTIEYRAWAGPAFDWQKGKENLANLRAFFKEIGGYVEHSQLAYESGKLPDGRYLDVVFVYKDTWCKVHQFLPGEKIKC